MFHVVKAPPRRACWFVCTASDRKDPFAPVQVLVVLVVVNAASKLPSSAAYAGGFRSSVTTSATTRAADTLRHEPMRPGRRRNKVGRLNRTHGPPTASIGQSTLMVPH